MIENLDLALKVKKQLEDYLAQLNYKKAIVNIDDISIKASRQEFEERELSFDRHHFSEILGYFTYDECLITKQLSDCIVGRLIGLLEPLSVNRELSRFEVNIRHASVIDLESEDVAIQAAATLWYEIKPYHKEYIDIE